MTRPLRIACLALFTVLAAPAGAQTAGDQVQDAIIAQLSGQGFTHIRVSTTFLGRVRIYATSPEYTREIIVNPRTGEILRDYWDDEDDDRGRLMSPSGSDRSGGASSRDRADRNDSRDIGQDDDRADDGGDNGDDDRADDRAGDRSDDRGDDSSAGRDDDREDDRSDDRDEEDEADEEDDKSAKDDEDAQDDEGDD